MKIILALLLISVILFGLNFHILRSDDGFEIITKDRMGIRDTYVDVRNWGMKDYVTQSPRIRNHLIQKSITTW